MFDRAKQELNRLKELVESLKQTTDERAFLTKFNDVVASAQIVLIELLKEGRGLRPPGFDQWYADAMQRMECDELMDIVKSARDFDFADGPHRLKFVKGSAGFSVDDQGRPVSSKTWWTPSGDPSLHTAMDNPPRTHAGEPLERNDPVSLSEEIADAMGELLDEALRATGSAG